MLKNKAAAFNTPRKNVSLHNKSYFGKAKTLLIEEYCHFKNLNISDWGSVGLEN